MWVPVRVIPGGDFFSEKDFDNPAGMIQVSRMSNPIPTNKPGSREFEETMHVFETTVAKGAKREAREFWKLGAYYTDGKVNELFKGFLHGMAYARNIINLES